MTDRILCHCLNIRESAVRDALANAPGTGIRCISALTGAGQGCTACHDRIRQLLANSPYASSEPICSAK
jgi:bacterioferritin-associated ferredoxin